MTADDDLERLTGPLADAADALRRPVVVRDEWRTALLDEVARDARPARSVWMVRPAVAIAAGFALLITGAGAALLIARPHAPLPADTTSTAATRSPVTVRFVYVGTDAREVSLVGDFNGWDPRAVQLRRLADGRTWIAEVPLSAGRYAYAFMVDGRLVADPTAARTPDDDFGAANSVLMVRGS
jgi:hypothetical protein